VEGLLREYHDTGAAEPQTSKATHAQTVLEIFAGKEVIENGGFGTYFLKILIY